jgi:hypothetical protein
MPLTIINSRSPFFVFIEEAGITNSEIYLYLWNGYGSAPANPTYILSKAATSQASTIRYNISPYISEFIDHDIRQNLYDENAYATPIEQWCNVKVDTYADGDLLETKEYLGVVGYGYYNEDANPYNGSCLLNQATYYYPYNITIDPADNELRQVGQLTIQPNTGDYVKWINLNTNDGFILTLDSSNVFEDVSNVIPDNIADGNMLTVYDASDNRLAEYIFKPLDECYYNPVTIDFVNKFGAWQRTFMFKASYKSLEVATTEYNLMQSDVLGYDILEGQRQTFNTNGVDRIKTNSGWVDADYAEVLRQLMLSERVLVNGSPAICLTKTLEIQDSLNINLINYVMEFKYAYDVINNVI